MAISRFSTSTVAQGLPKYQKLWDGTSAVLTSSYESIATVTLGSNSGSIILSSIPQTYKHLQVRLHNKFSYTTNGDFSNLVLRANYAEGGTQAYSRHVLMGTGATVASGGGASENPMYVQTFVPSSHSSYANIWGATILDILDYTNTNKYKTVRALGGYDTNNQAGYGRICLASGLWQSTAALVSLQFNLDSDQFVAGTRISLYGIKG